MILKNDFKNINNLVKSLNKNVIYTTIIGGYDDLPKLLNGSVDGWDYVCFTDDKNLKNEDWQIIYIDNNCSDDKRLSRYFKTNFHDFFYEYETILYIDASMDVNINLYDYSKLLKNNDILFLIHPFNKNIKEEMDLVLKINYENITNINKLKEKYLKEKYVYDNGLFAGGILIYKNNKNIIYFYNDWWFMINNYSHRDQLTLNYVLSKHNLKHGTIKYNNVINKYFIQREHKKNNKQI